MTEQKTKEKTAAKPRAKRTTQAQPKKPAVKKYEPSDLIYCTSVFPGEVLMQGRKTGNIYDWMEMGDTIEVEYQDLMAEIINRRSAFIHDPLIMVEDRDIVESRPELKALYKKIYSQGAIYKILKSGNSNSITRMLNTIPEAMKDNIRTMASTMIQNRELDSIMVIRALDKHLGTDFETMISVV